MNVSRIKTYSVLLLLVTVLLSPLIATVIWVVVMKQYHLSVLEKVVVVFVCGLVATVAIFGGISAGLDTGQLSYPTIGLGLVIGALPMIYSLVKPLDKATAKV